jgi:hypothetical protein
MSMIRKASLPLLLAAVVAACSSENRSVLPRISLVDDTHIAVHARGLADAVVAADGTLAIDGRAVAVTAPQQESLKRYYAGVTALHRDAVATGKAGMRTAGKAIGSVVSGLVNGDTDKIGDKVEAEAAKVEAAAMTVCRDVSAIQAEQIFLTGQLEAFRPYAVIDARSVADCEHGGHA